MSFNWAERSLKFDFYSGVVMSTQKWSETRVHSSGGGGYVHQGSGHVSAPTVSSTVSSKHEFWIQAQDGQQIPVQLTDADFPLMAGQLITLVSVPLPKKPNEPRWVYVRNHSAKQSWILNGPVKVTASLMHARMRPASIGAAIGLLVLGFFLNQWIFAAGAIGYIGYRLFARVRTYKANTALLEDHLKQITPNLVPAAAPTGAPAA
jgi:hypothetical protein